MPEHYLEAVRAPGQAVNPWFSLLGLRLASADAHGAVLVLPFRPEFLQAAGAVPGGLLATLLDEAMAHALLARLERGWACATIGLTVNYLRPCRGGDLTCRARVDKLGGRVAFVSAVVETGQGLALTTGTATFSVFARAEGIDRTDKEG